jgi:hypothetical protein
MGLSRERMRADCEKTALFLFIYLKKQIKMETNFSYNFATYSKQESPQLDIEAILDNVDYIVCPHKRICRLKDDDRSKVLYLFHNAVPYVAIHRDTMAGEITVKEMKSIKSDYDGPGTLILYYGRMNYESVHLTRNHARFTRDTNLDCYFSIHRNNAGETILYIGSKDTKCL